MLVAMSGRPTMGPAPEHRHPGSPTSGVPTHAWVTVAPPADGRTADPSSWWEANRRQLWAWVGWTSAAVVVLAGIAVLWLLLTDNPAGDDPYLGLLSSVAWF